MDTYEKEYKDALRRANEYHCDGIKQCIIDTLEYIFPELKESEDEKIRKGIKSILEHYKESGEVVCPYPFVSIDEALTWLEKQGEIYTKKDVDDAYLQGISDTKNELEKQGEQKPYGQRGECLDCQFNYAGECKGSCQMKRGEQKPADKVESKFKIGDWITNKGHSYLIADIDYEQRRYLFEVGGYTHEQLNWEYIENADNKYHLWTIEDAKDGDVLIDKSGSRECPFIFKKTKPSDIKTDMLNPLTVLGYCGIGGAGFTKGSGWGDTVNCIYYPATKEQRDLLFQKMHEAGYMWDSESKQLLSLKAKPNDTQNPAWSEEDETNSYHLKTLLENLAKDNKYEFRIISDNDRDKYTAWLKSLKQRIGG